MITNYRMFFYSERKRKGSRVKKTHVQLSTLGYIMKVEKIGSKVHICIYIHHPKQTAILNSPPFILITRWDMITYKMRTTKNGQRRRIIDAIYKNTFPKDIVCPNYDSFIYREILLLFHIFLNGNLTKE